MSLLENLELERARPLPGPVLDSPSASGSRMYRSDIDSLRSVAVLSDHSWTDPAGHVQHRSILRAAFQAHSAGILRRAHLLSRSNPPHPVSVGSAPGSRDIFSLKLSDGNLVVIDPKAVFCSQSACKFADEDNIYYVDEEHVGRLGALQILPLPHL